ncbi:MAG: GNAT family N-acetyltransferase [Dichotomicrobium sp.]
MTDAQGHAHIRLAEATPDMLRRVLDLNNAHKVETSELSQTRLEAMIATACAAWALPDASAFLLAFAETASYDSANFLWFRSRYPRFVYVDRIVVSPERRGTGVARAFYEALFAETRRSGRAMVACEVNVTPPNPGSAAFHDRLGFQPVAQAETAAGKTVRYMIRDLSGRA